MAEAQAARAQKSPEEELIASLDRILRESDAGVQQVLRNADRARCNAIEFYQFRTRPQGPAPVVPNAAASPASEASAPAANGDAKKVVAAPAQ